MRAGNSWKRCVRGDSFGAIRFAHCALPVQQRDKSARVAQRPAARIINYLLPHTPAHSGKCGKVDVTRTLRNILHLGIPSLFIRVHLRPNYFGN